MNMKNYVIAREAVIKHSEGKKPTSGKIPCPICQTGTLKYTVASNGHVHAFCSTEDCMAWME